MNRRIRTLKPEFFEDEKLAPLAPIHRLVFIGLISIADDAGRLIDNLKTIDAAIFPRTDDSAEESLRLFAAMGRILRYEVPSGQRLIQIVNWARHQKIDRPSPRVLPPPALPCSGPSPDAAVTSELAPTRDQEMDDDPRDGAASAAGPTTSAASRRPFSSRHTRKNNDVDALSRAPRETLANPRRSDLGSWIEEREQRTPERDLAVADGVIGDGRNPDRFAALLARRGVRLFLAKYYGLIDGDPLSDRQADVLGQLSSALTSTGVTFRGSRLRMIELDHLDEVCGEIASRTSVREPDAAIVLALLRLSETWLERKAALSSAVRSAEEAQRGQLILDARAWVAAHPDILEQVERKLSQAVPSHSTGAIVAPARSILRDELLLEAYMARAESP